MDRRIESPNLASVKARADHMLDGSIVPVMFREEDGPVCRIDRVLNVRNGTSLKSGGGLFIRYLCRVGERTYALRYEPPFWYVEK